MDFMIIKCAMLTMKKGKRKTNRGNKTGQSEKHLNV